MELIVVGIVIGMWIGMFISNLGAAGTLRIDHSNPEKDVYRFEIDNWDKFTKKNRVLLKVDHKAKLSQE